MVRPYLSCLVTTLGTTVMDHAAPLFKAAGLFTALSSTQGTDPMTSRGRNPQSSGPGAGGAAI